MIISVTTVTMSDIGKAICKPLRIWGRAAGTTIFQTTRRGLTPRLRADQIR